MKKKLLHLSICFVFLTLTGFVFADPLVQPVRTLTIPYANTDDITIDGVAEPYYSAVQSTDSFNPTGSTGADVDYTFSFQVACNLEYLYLLGEIIDDIDNSPVFTTDSNIWTYDNVEVYISLDTTGSTYPTVNGYEDDSNCVQIRFCRGLDSIQTPGRATQEEYIYYWENTAIYYEEDSVPCWVFEVAIPWKAVLAEGQVTEDICEYDNAGNGFEVHGSDSDTPGPDHRDCQTSWDNDDPSDPLDRTEDNAWTDRRLFGIFTFGFTCEPWQWPYSISEINTDKNFKVYPNPASNALYFEIENVNTIRIYSLTGVLLKEVETTGEVDISNLKRGMYMAESNNGFVRFIKE